MKKAVERRRIAEQLPGCLLSSIYACGYCNFVSGDRNLSKTDTPCPNCGKPGPRYTFPDGFKSEYLEMVGYFYTKHCDYIDERRKSLLEAIERETYELVPIEIAVEIKKRIQKITHSSSGSQEDLDKIHEIIQEGLDCDYKIAQKLFHSFEMYNEISREGKVVIILAWSFVESLDKHLLSKWLDKIGFDGSNIFNYIYYDGKSIIRNISKKERKEFVKLRCEFNELIKESDIWTEFQSDYDFLKRLRIDIIHVMTIFVTGEDIDRGFDIALKAPGVVAQLQNEFCLKESDE